MFKPVHSMSKQRPRHSSDSSLSAIMWSTQREAAAAVESSHRYEKRLREADLLVRAGEFEAALKIYLRLYDFERHEIGFDSVELHELVAHIVALGRQFPRAEDALQKRRDAAEQLLVEGIGGADSVFEVHTLNNVLGESDRTISLYHRLNELGPKQQQLHKQMTLMMLELLVGAKRYHEALGEDALIRSRLRQLMEAYWALSARKAGASAAPGGEYVSGRTWLGLPHPTQSAEMQRDSADASQSPKVLVRGKLLELGGLYFEALLGVGDHVAAGTLAEQLLDSLEGDDVRDALLTHAKRAAPDAIPDVLVKNADTEPA